MGYDLVTGATGLLGSALTRRLAALGRRVRILRRASSRLDLLGDLAGEVEHAIADVTDVVSLEEAFSGVDRVFHAAAYVGLDGSRDRQRLLHVNVDGTAAVVNAALRAGVTRFVHVSSIAALGRPEEPDGVIDENAEWRRSRANSAYGYSKHLAEIEVFRGIAEGLDAVIVNPGLIFGRGRPGENTRLIIDRVRRRRTPVVPAGGTLVVDVEDVADGMLRAVENGRTGERYVFGSENLSWVEIVETLAAAFDVRPPRLVVPPGPALVLASFAEAIARVLRTRPLVTRETARTASRFYRYSNRKAVGELGCRFQPFEETAERIASELTRP